ncbi:hypothetical protein NCL57_004311 [Salmonella enterica]|nr:hypothetical protein [Salmonella enterica]EJH1054373.1 hypothetical protein [Salmonella enterica]
MSKCYLVDLLAMFCVKLKIRLGRIRFSEYVVIWLAIVLLAGGLLGIVALYHFL